MIRALSTVLDFGFRFFRLVCGAGLCACSWTGPAPAATLELPPLHDAVLYEDAGGAQASGAGDFLVAGRNNQGTNSRRRAVLQFDLSALPAGAAVDSVTLRLHLTATVTTDDATLTLHRVNMAWTEGPGNPTGNEPSGVPPLTGDTTWLHASFPGALWSAPGGDFVAIASASTVVTNSSGFFLWSGDAMLADVNQWLADPAQNHGWLLRTDESVPQTAKRFESRDNTATAFRPALVVEYTIIPEPNTALLLVALVSWRSGRRRIPTPA
jgi:hypothetical protein